MINARISPEALEDLKEPSLISVRIDNPYLPEPIYAGHGTLRLTFAAENARKNLDLRGSPVRKSLTKDRRKKVNGRSKASNPSETAILTTAPKCPRLTAVPIPKNQKPGPRSAFLPHFSPFCRYEPRWTLDRAKTRRFCPWLAVGQPTKPQPVFVPNGRPKRARTVVFSALLQPSKGLDGRVQGPGRKPPAWAKNRFVFVTPHPTVATVLPVSRCAERLRRWTPQLTRRKHFIVTFELNGPPSMKPAHDFLVCFIRPDLRTSWSLAG